MSSRSTNGQLAVGEPVDLSNCDREPIQIPGSIQPHGALITVDQSMTVRQASANTEMLLSRTPAELIGCPLGGVVGPAAASAIAEADRSKMTDGLQLHRLRIAGRSLETRVHESDGMLVCEFEQAATFPEDETWFARELTQTMSRFQRGEGVQSLAEMAAGEVKRLTGYDRVMVYRFDADGHGEVIAEARRERLESYLGQHYPATDIPRQARALYLKQILRQIVDIDYVPSPIEPAENPLTGKPLDLGLATLRSVSPIHLQYLRNMGVKATLTISLKHEDELWGMIACHHYTPRYLTPQVRAACTLVGEVLSLQFAREELADQRRTRDGLAERRRSLLASLRDSPSLAAGLQQHRDALRTLCDADGVAVMLDGMRVTCGVVADIAAEQQLVDHLQRQSPLVTDRLPGDLPDVGARTSLCGALAVNLPRGVGEYVIWYRKEWRHELVWGGDPNDSLQPDLSSKDAKSLNPRRSFEAWRQAVVGRSRPWTDAQVDTAAELARELVEQVVASMRDRLAHLALYDPLTGLANRTLLNKTLEQTLARRPRAGREHVGVLFLDIDNFKLINDSFGHGGGDALLQEVGARLSALLRTGDLVARLGGDEFVVLMQGINDPGELERAAGRIQTAFVRPFALMGAETRTTASIGVTTAELGVPRDAEDVIHEADVAMYEAKRSGRGRWIHYGAELSESRRRRVEMERRLASAMMNGELTLQYQPLLDGTLAVAGFEALARWHSPDLGQVPPSDFIPLAEEVGLMDEIGGWVLDTALGALADVRDAVGRDLFMAINISAAQLADISLPERIEMLLERHGIPGELVCLEITEGVLIANTDFAVPLLERLRDLGIRIALDDFGTGFSSLAYLRRLPVDVLKIDRAFVAELGRTESGTDAEVVAAVLDLARRLEIETVAEGVETEEQLAILRTMHCNLLQGFLFSKPIGDEFLTAFVQAAGRRGEDGQPARRIAARRASAHRTGTGAAPSAPRRAL